MTLSFTGQLNQQKPRQKEIFFLLQALYQKAVVPLFLGKKGIKAIGH